MHEKGQKRGAAEQAKPPPKGKGKPGKGKQAKGSWGTPWSTWDRREATWWGAATWGAGWLPGRKRGQ